MIKKICIVPVCYNAHDDALRFLASVDVAFKNCSNVFLDVVLSDNSTVPPPVELEGNRYSFSYRYLRNTNVGYFPAFNRAVNVLPMGVGEYEFVVVCNVDLIIAEDFLERLSVWPVSPDVGLVAPGIFSDKDGRDLNPKMMRRPTSLKINFMRLICSNVLLFRCYHKLVRMREKARSRSQPDYFSSGKDNRLLRGQKMYGAHGSFMIFTKKYFSQGASINYPRFLFGEEGFVAEQLRQYQLVIEHAPALRIFDKEHASTSQVKLKFICAEHKKSYDYFYKNFLKGKS